ncbi:MAG: peptide ABC transporter ATP-binding protein, partial [Prosthecobacter sp.]|nr:peptide ABC transporter ATP-binding protein [Prosthecobacter sp.]
MSEPSSAPILEVRDLVTAFDTDSGRMTAVDGVSFDVPHGKVLGGSIRFEGRDLLKLSLEEVQDVRGNDISMIFQEPMTALNPVQTVGKQIAEAILLHK